MGPNAVIRLLQGVLLPLESVIVGSLLRILREVAAREHGPEPGEAGTASGCGSAAQSCWEMKELWEFLETSQPSQIALLMALASERGRSLSARTVARKMQIAAWQLYQGPSDVVVDARSIGAALSGFSRRAQMSHREALVCAARGRYRINKRYADWIASWLTARGLDLASLGGPGESVWYSTEPPRRVPVALGM